MSFSYARGLIYAHRSSRGLAPENTLLGCQKSLTLGVDYIELDIGMTKDYQLVATHDLSLNPALTRDSKGNFIKETPVIFEMTYQQLKEFNVGKINPQSDYAAYFPQQIPSENEKIPLLKEVIEFVSVRDKKVQLLLEIKTDPEQSRATATPEIFAKELLKILKEYDFCEKTEVQSFDFRNLLWLQKLDKQIKTAYLYHQQGENWMAGYSPKHFGHSVPKMIHALGGSCFCPFQMDVTASLVKESQELGLKIVPWGYPEKEGSEFNFPQILKLIDWKVDGIITDRPDILKQMELLRHE